MADLRSSYLGFPLAHPLVASSSPLTRELDSIRRLEDAGAAAIVMPSIYQEEVEAHEEAFVQLVEQGSLSQPEAGGYFSGLFEQVGGLEARLETVRRARESCSIPIIVSLNGSRDSGWVEFAREVESAGASAIELNLYRVPADLDESGQAVEARWLETIRAVKATVTVPLAVKLGPWLSSPGHFARQVAASGASGLCLFNRFYQPDIDLATLSHVPKLQLSTPYEMRQALLWISLLSGRLSGVDLAATTGVEHPADVVKYLLSGANVVMSASALLRHGPEYIGTLRQGLDAWLDERGFVSVGAARGLLCAAKVSSGEGLLRAQYIETLLSHSP